MHLFAESGYVVFRLILGGLKPLRKNENLQNYDFDWNNSLQIDGHAMEPCSYVSLIIT